MTETERMDAKDRALIAKCEEELARLSNLFATLRTDRRTQRDHAHNHRNLAGMELDFGERRNARWQRHLLASCRSTILDIKSRLLLLHEDYRDTFKDMTNARKDIGRRNTPEYDRPRYHLGGGVFSTRQIIEGDRP